MYNNSSRPLRRLLRHTASVPKGFLRFYVLRLLKMKSMSGSEIMGEIGKHTGGRWIPSPGSVYPLLAWLQDNDYIKEAPTEESGMRRYVLTDKGSKFFEEQSKLREKLQEKLEFFAPSFLSGFWFSSHPERLAKIREPGWRFIKSLFELRRALEENVTEQSLEEVAEFLNSTTDKIEEMSKKIRETKQNG